MRGPMCISWGLPLRLGLHGVGVLSRRADVAVFDIYGLRGAICGGRPGGRGVLVALLLLPVLLLLLLALLLGIPFTAHINLAEHRVECLRRGMRCGATFNATPSTPARSPFMPRHASWWIVSPAGCRLARRGSSVSPRVLPRTLRL